jgi:hypothetical protein
MFTMSSALKTFSHKFKFSGDIFSNLFTVYLESRDGIFSFDTHEKMGGKKKGSEKKFVSYVRRENLKKATQPIPFGSLYSFKVPNPSILHLEVGPIMAPRVKHKKKKDYIDPYSADVMLNLPFPKVPKPPPNYLRRLFVLLVSLFISVLTLETFEFLSPLILPATILVLSVVLSRTWLPVVFLGGAWASGVVWLVSKRSSTAFRATSFVLLSVLSFNLMATFIDHPNG